MTLEDYNRCMGTDEKLESAGDVLVYPKDSLKTDNIDIFGMDLHVTGRLNEFMASSNAAANITNGSYVIVKDDSVMEQLLEKNLEVYGNNAFFISFNYMVDVAGDAEENNDAIVNAYDEARQQIDSLHQPEGSSFENFTGSLYCRTVESESFGTDFTGLFFVGIFLGMLFLMATVLIMYYKQLTEGYEDKKTVRDIAKCRHESYREVRRNPSTPRFSSSSSCRSFTAGSTCSRSTSRSYSG